MCQLKRYRAPPPPPNEQLATFPERFQNVTIQPFQSVSINVDISDKQDKSQTGSAHSHWGESVCAERKGCSMGGRSKTLRQKRLHSLELGTYATGVIVSAKAGQTPLQRDADANSMRHFLPTAYRSLG